jgi:hypothetical protein
VRPLSRWRVSTSPLSPDTRLRWGGGGGKLLLPPGAALRRSHPAQLAHLRRERSSLEEEMGATRLDPAEARERLLAKVKEDNARIQALDAQLRAANEELGKKKKARGRGQGLGPGWGWAARWGKGAGCTPTRHPPHASQISAELTTDLEERRGEAGDAAKYDLLFKRDQEMTEFIDRFHEMRDKEVRARARVGRAPLAGQPHCPPPSPSRACRGRWRSSGARKTPSPRCWST